MYIIKRNSCEGSKHPKKVTFNVQKKFHWLVLCDDSGMHHDQCNAPASSKQCSISEAFSAIKFNIYVGYFDPTTMSFDNKIKKKSG